ncbi:ribbon-helix-helix protein, CopG family [Marivirga harenae]|uniref:ribbon-helix-helix protein, CopG family n=1 Tax=Marivirga harenae TaxID=2010992 RepID=UPI0026E03797|nr:ribbon-helix-helix protein, CopG family [Marivirga harenae]WKV12194.1 ribbon-helix-helix protein, CopG family [Marivirga harenae]
MKNEEVKENTLYCRLDKLTMDTLDDYAYETGLSKSQIVREAIRRLIHETITTGNLSINMYVKQPDLSPD